MSATMTKAAPTYLREARLAAGYANRDTASAEVPYSPETIGRHERGDVPVAPEDAMIYARSYGRDDILIRYCADCPVGRATGKQVTDRPLPFATLRMSRMIDDAQTVANCLESIAFDGIIDDKEREDFNAALGFLRRLNESINDMILLGTGIEKARPADAEASHSRQEYSITNVPPCQSPNPWNTHERRREDE